MEFLSFLAVKFIRTMEFKNKLKDMEEGVLLQLAQDYSNIDISEGIKVEIPDNEAKIPHYHFLQVDTFWNLQGILIFEMGTSFKQF